MFKDGLKSKMDKKDDSTARGSRDHMVIVAVGRVE
jgi:hypothetical protein